MRKIYHAMLLVASLSMFGLSGCATLGAGTSSTGSGAGITAAEVAKQADGVAAALEALPKAPGDEATAKTIQGYAAWAAFLARSAAVVVGAVGS
ncbi:hypothetical protein [Solidesulfovibrio sp.]